MPGLERLCIESGVQLGASAFTRRHAKGLTGPSSLGTIASHRDYPRASSFE
jgi:hypothetical protein